MSTEIEVGAGIYTGDANAISTDILISKTAYINNIKVVGSMPNVSGGHTASAAEQDAAGNVYLVVPADGYMAAGSYIAAAIANLAPEYIKSGVEILGVTGTYTPTIYYTTETIDTGVDIPGCGNTYSFSVTFSGNINSMYYCTPQSDTQVYVSGPSISGNTVTYTYKNTFYSSSVTADFTLSASIICYT